jgi:hypothetical protein
MTTKPLSPAHMVEPAGLTDAVSLDEGVIKMKKRVVVARKSHKRAAVGAGRAMAMGK